jgi:lipopolysaccharide biosynthesis regulator YciM
MSGYGPLLAVLIALLIGLTIGKAWERYKLRDGKWIDRRRARQSPHYILGLNFLVANQIDLAIEELSRAASLDADALEVHMILGNLYREKGQVGKAIAAHQGCCSGRGSASSSTPMSCCAWASTTSAADSSIARSRRSTKC